MAPPHPGTPGAAGRRIDCHVHLVGDGASGSGCWLRPRSALQRVQIAFMLRACGLPFRPANLDEVLERRIAGMVEGSSLDAAVLLAQDLPHHPDGTPLPEKTLFHVSNDHLLAVCARRPGLFIPAVSIHPARRDALAELERCLAAGARILKLLPNCLGVDYSAPHHAPFWKMMARHGMILLSHTGGEMMLPVVDQRLADPSALRYPLDHGVTVIAAHCAGRSGLWDRDHTAELLEMFRRHPRLYGDNSALCLPLRAATAPKILPEAIRARVVHGSDFPVPAGGFGPWRMGLINGAAWRKASAERNILERDVFLKREMGFGEDNLTRLDGLLSNAAP